MLVGLIAPCDTAGILTRREETESALEKPPNLSLSRKIMKIGTINLREQKGDGRKKHNLSSPISH